MNADATPWVYHGRPRPPISRFHPSTSSTGSGPDAVHGFPRSIRYFAITAAFPASLCGLRDLCVLRVLCVLCPLCVLREPGAIGALYTLAPGV